MKGNIVLTNQTKCKAEIQNQSIAVPIIAGWSFYSKKKIMKVENEVTNRYEISVWK